MGDPCKKLIYLSLQRLCIVYNAESPMPIVSVIYDVLDKMLDICICHTRLAEPSIVMDTIACSKIYVQHNCCNYHKRYSFYILLVFFFIVLIVYIVPHKWLIYILYAALLQVHINLNFFKNIDKLTYNNYKKIFLIF
jgi:hypothetical protein